MVQSGVAYAAGQLLAVVAPRTVLVVDAPTDWSLAGPLWELALDDAPVDEILDVLIRRGIRTSPSFAIVRVETDAVRALVRGSVPVCFERVGEPVRLDATGATTWLEGLISGARRVLVGDVEANTSLPFLVTTGVVLVSGLALPCGPVEPERRQISSTVTPEPEETPSTPGAPSAADDAPSESPSYFTPPVPVSSSGGPYAPVAGREPRVVDLTRSEPRSPVRSYSAAPEARESRESRPFSSDWVGAPSTPRTEVNGRSSDSRAKPDAGTAAKSGSRTETGSRTDSESRSESDSLFGAPSAFESGPSPAKPEASPFEPPANRNAPSSFKPSTPSARGSDDPGELHDMDDSVMESAPAENFRPSADFRPSPEAFDARPQTEARGFPETDSDSDPLTGPRPSGSPDPLDDLLIEPSDDELPPTPSPADLPKLDPPSLALPLPSGLNGSAPVPAQPRGFGGVPAAWPPAREDPAVDEAPSGERRPNAWEQPVEKAEPVAEVSVFARPQRDTPAEPDRYDDTSDSDSSAEDQTRLDELPELPLRVRGRSLRPEQSAPAPAPVPTNGRSAGMTPPPVVESPEFPVPPSSPIPPLRVLGEGRFRNVAAEPGPQQQHRAIPDVINRQQEPPVRQDTPSRQDNRQDNYSNQDGSPEDAGPDAQGGPASGSLLLPAFFRGSRAVRKPGTTDEPESSAAAEAPQREDAPAQSGPIPGVQNGSAVADSSQVAWAPPVRRGYPERPGFNGGPPSMPGVLRPLNSNGGTSYTRATSEDYDDRPTEHQSAPSYTPDSGIDVEDAAREPSRLLGVWCDAGHVTSPDRSECRVCGLSVPPQAPILVARPPLGVLIFDNGDRVEVDRPVVLGRDPKPIASADPDAPILHAVSSGTGQVSRTHAEIRADGWDVVLTDLGAMNGTALTLPGESPVAIEPGMPTVMTPGARVDLGGESGFVFEIEG